MIEKLEFIALFIAGIIVGLAIGYTVGHWQGVTSGKSQAHTKTLEKAVDVNDQKAKIRNNRPNAVGVVNRLRVGTF